MEDKNSIQPDDSKGFISVIIPAYQASDVLERCVESVIKQEYPKTEIILVDDGSTDPTLSVAGDLQKRYPCIRIFQLSHRGVSISRNQGIKEAVGEWLLFLDADDEFCSGALNTLADEMANGYDAICGKVVRGSQCACKKSEIKTVYGSTQKHELLDDVMADPTNKLTCHAWMFRRSVVRQNNIWFSSALRIGEDSDWMMRFLSACGDVCFLEAPVYRYTVSADSTIHQWRSGMADEYLKTLAALSESSAESEKNWPLFVLTSFLLILTHDVFHRNNPASFYAKMRRARVLKSIPPFHNAFRTADYSSLNMTKRIVLKCIQYDLFVFAYIAVRMRQRQNLYYEKQRKRELEESL